VTHLQRLPDGRHPCLAYWACFGELCAAECERRPLADGSELGVCKWLNTGISGGMHVEVTQHGVTPPSYAVYRKPYVLVEVMVYAPKWALQDPEDA
jgi:hypothetical protein